MKKNAELQKEYKDIYVPGARATGLPAANSSPVIFTIQAILLSSAQVSSFISYLFAFVSLWSAQINMTVIYLAK